MKMKGTFVTGEYLKVPHHLFSDYLWEMPITNHESIDIGDLQKTRQDVKSYQTFSFRDIDYEVCIEKGRAFMEPVDHENSEEILDHRDIPIPHGIDDEIKELLLRSIPCPEKIGQFGVVHHDQIDKLIEIIRENALANEKTKYTYDQVYFSLYRILESRYYVRRSGLKEWYPIPWTIDIMFPDLTEDSYNKLVKL